MSNALISHSDDLARLRKEGYNLEVRSGHLLVHDIPYVTPQKVIERGTLVSPLDVNIDKTRPPGSHQAWFIGNHPCDVNGQPLSVLAHSSETKRLAADIEVHHAFSAKPPSGGYVDFYIKMIAYINIIVSHTRELEPGATAATFPIIRDDEEDSPFVYMDTASTRAGIRAITDRLRGHRVAIVGLGGTGSYILDFVAKTPVAEIHLYDGDEFEQHTAFRSPGASTEDELRAREAKVMLLARRYSAMHRGIVGHGFLDEKNVEQLKGLDFVFVSIDVSEIKPMIIARLESFGVPFVDVGMGLHAVDNALVGLVRTTTSTPQMREHVHGRHRIPLVQGAAANAYDTNIQVAELNALNAALAVIKWKKYVGFYLDLEREHFSVFQLSGNSLINEECA